MSSFTVGGTTVTFTALETSFNDKGGPLEEITIGVEFDDPTGWGAFFSLRSWSVSQRPIPGGNNVVVDISGGAGEGHLAIDNLDPHNAVMTDLVRTNLEPGSLRSIARATFLITG